MQKEIFEQPESVVNTMRGRVSFEKVIAAESLDSYKLHSTYFYKLLINASTRATKTQTR